MSTSLNVSTIFEPERLKTCTNEITTSFLAKTAIFYVLLISFWGFVNYSHGFEASQVC